MAVASLVAAGIGLATNYVQGRVAQNEAAAKAKAQKARFASAKMATARSVGKMLPPTGTRSEGSSGSGVIPSAAGDVFPGLGLTSGDVGGTGLTPGKCPGIMQVRIGGRCVDLTALPPGGRPAVVGQVPDVPQPDNYGDAVLGWYGVGLQPAVEVRQVLQCPPGFKLGKDEVCYEHLSRKERKWDPGMKPLLTGGDRAAIARAARAARSLDRAKKTLKRAGRSLEKAC